MARRDRGGAVADAAGVAVGVALRDNLYACYAIGVYRRSSGVSADGADEEDGEADEGEDRGGGVHICMP